MKIPPNPTGPDSRPTHDEWVALLSDPDVDESGGEHNNDGVDFARYWAMYQVVALERAKRDDYALLFEYIQDVALFDSSSTPTSAHLFQLKKKDRREWSIPSLCKRADAADENPDAVDENPDTPDNQNQSQFDMFGPPIMESHNDSKASSPKRTRKTRKLKGQSPLGKLYLSVAKLPATVTGRGTFVSNAPLTATVMGGGSPTLHSPLPFDTLCEADTNSIHSRLTKELGLGDLPHLSKLMFEHTRLQPATMRETVRGALGELLVDELKLPDTSGQLVTKLFDAFSKLGGRKKLMSSLKDIVEAKGFTKEAFGKLLEAASAASDFGANIDVIIDDLKREGMPPLEANRLKATARRLAIRFVHTPAERDTLHWHDAVTSARTVKEGVFEYRHMLDLISEDMTALLNVDGGLPISSTEIRALALLATIHVENEPETPRA
ncbi:dsDNA nuclease domain-containing protein [Burkholderia pseudomallei]|uniref:dsDNA nuclease domain-containing protein n=1 Tax=Burkholderia pseudomallei TaxID=28450 RepID=UPI001AD62E1A|nr:dsDNA nuclease domain-containing protein [Burkholderia pseudomallei]MBO7822135.1 DUF4297 domain-containing protein [Burkholderia pseudomallei]